VAGLPRGTGEGGVSHLDIDRNNAFYIKTIGLTIATFETLPPEDCRRRCALAHVLQEVWHAFCYLLRAASAQETAQTPRKDRRRTAHATRRRVLHPVDKAFGEPQG
jgi:hypothetical protein